MKHYYVKHGNFANVYSLCYTDSPAGDAAALEQGYERITRQEAFHLCAVENQRRKWERSSSGYADNVIYPVDWPDDACRFPSVLEYNYIVIK